MKLPEPAVPASSLITRDGVWGNLYTETQLKQAVRDALEAAAKVCSDECINWDFNKGLFHAESKILKLMEGV
jgi:hypothetical protein